MLALAAFATPAYSLLPGHTLHHFCPSKFCAIPGQDPRTLAPEWACFSQVSP